MKEYSRVENINEGLKIFSMIENINEGIFKD